MTKLLAAAVSALVLGSVALVSAKDQGLDPAPATVAERLAAQRDPEAARRVSLAFTTSTFDPATARRGAETIEGPTPRQTADRPAAPAARAWFASDRSLQRGDIVVWDGDALVYEGVKNGKRHFRTVGLSRLVSDDERDRILKSVRR